MKLIELVDALLLMTPEKFAAFKALLLEAAAVPLMVSLLVTPATLAMLMVPPKEIPSALLLEPSRVTSPLIVKARPPCTKMPRCLMFWPVVKVVASPANVNVVPVAALAVPLANIMKAPKPRLSVVDAALMPLTVLAALVPPAPVVPMVPPFQARPVNPVLVVPMALMYWPDQLAEVLMPLALPLAPYTFKLVVAVSAPLIETAFEAAVIPAPLVIAPVAKLMEPFELSRETFVPERAAELLSTPPVVCKKSPAPLAMAWDAAKVLPDCRNTLPVVAAVVIAALVVMAPVLVLPILRVPAEIRFISALVIPSVSGEPVNTSAPPTLIKVPAVRF